MKQYKIVGSRKINGYLPGDIVSGSDLAASNIDHLIAAGHIEPVKSGKLKTTVTAQVDERSEDLEEEQ